MIVAQARPLFAWDCLENSPSLKTIRDLLPLLPDSPLVQRLGAAAPDLGQGTAGDATHLSAKRSRSKQAASPWSASTPG